jgi:hypothetical protein
MENNISNMVGTIRCVVVGKKTGELLDLMQGLFEIHSRIDRFIRENYVGRDDARDELLNSYTDMNEIVKNMLVESIDTNGAVTNYKIL